MKVVSAFRHALAVLVPEIVGVLVEVEGVTNGAEEGAFRAGGPGVGFQEPGQRRVIEAVGSDELLSPRVEGRAAVDEVLSRSKSASRCMSRAYAVAVA